jgi:hypothetical protein
MPTPVGPAPRDPNDPDFWDWGDDDDEDGTSVPRRRVSWAGAFIAVIVVLALVLLLVNSRP